VSSPRRTVARKMQQFFLDGTAVKTSALAFGCAGLFREPSPRRRSEILHGALDLGITHFDVAPMYGMGLAESELGAFAKGQRSGLTITTKFGIAPSRVGGLIGRVQRPVREFMKAVPAARAQAQTAAATPDAGRLGAILYQSVGYLEHAKTAGLIRAWGLSGDQNDVSGSLRELSSVPVLQVRYPESPSLPPSRAGRIHFGVLNYAVETVVPALRSHTDRQLEWRDALGVDLTAPEAIASLAIQQALAEYPDSVVLFSSTSPAHVRAAAQAASQAADPDALLTFERLLAEVRS
jgi:D-threo-aldose 1-dehydrogenase